MAPIRSHDSTLANFPLGIPAWDFRPHLRCYSVGRDSSNRYISVGAGESIQIHLGNDFFLVEDRGTYTDCTSMGAVAGTKLYVIKKINGEWTELNNGICGDPIQPATCAVDFKDNYGESGYTAIGCMAHKANNLLVSTGKNQFHIVDPNTGIIFSYFAAQFGQGFTEKSASYASFGGSVQKAGFPMNWEWTITDPVQVGEDYFLVKSKSSNTVRIDILHHDGWEINRLGGPVHTYVTGTAITNAIFAEASASFRAWISDDYFITTGAQAGTSAEFWYKRIQKDQNGVPVGIGFNAYGLRNDIPFESQSDIRVATSPISFSIEIYPQNGAPGGQPNKAPLLESGGTDYRSYLYQVNPYETEMEDIYVAVDPVQYKDGNNRLLYDFEFSASENLLSAKSCLSSTNGACNGENSDLVTYYSALMAPWRALNEGAFIRHCKPIYNPWVAGSYSYNHDQFIRSTSARIGAQCMLNVTSRHVEFTLLQSTGTGFTQFPYQITVNSQPWADLNFITKVKSYAGIAGQGDGRWTEHVFKYTPTGSTFLTKNPEYNIHHQSFIFPNVSVSTYRGSESMPSPLVVGAETINHLINESGSPLQETHFDKLGRVTERRLDDMKMVQGETLFERRMSKTTYEYYDPQRESTWPDMLYMTRLKKTTSTKYDRNSSTQSNTTTFHKYNPFSNSPLFVKSNIGGKWNLTQTLYNGSGTNRGIPIGHNSFKFSTEPPDAVLNGWSNPHWDFNQDNAVEKAISASRVEFDAERPFQLKKTKVWKDADPTLNTDEMKRGVEPIHSLAEGWQEQQVVEKWNALGQGMESRILLTGSGNDRRKVLVYEGRSSLPVAEFDNAYYEDVAALTGENFNVVGLLTHDWQGRWVKADAGATQSMSHSGRASIKVVSNSGPRTDLLLKGPESQGYDYLVSAWIYCEPGTTPALKVERFRAGNSTPLDGITATSPDGENLVSDKWQRFQVKLSAAYLRNSNLFTGTGSGDFLRVSAGTSGTGTVYVDDIVCRPSTATYALRSYNGKQQLTHIMDMNQNMATYDYDLFGKPSSVRDDKHRIFTSTASHQPGEND